MKTLFGQFRKISAGGLCVVTALGLCLATDCRAQAPAQGVPNAMQGFSQNREQPVRIEAAAFEILKTKNRGTFSGNVTVVQGDTTMKSRTLVVFYDSREQAPTAAKSQPPGVVSRGEKGPAKQTIPAIGTGSAIRRIEAHSNVVVTQKDQTVTGETAVFDTRTNLITMRGGVVLTQCGNVLRGDRLLVDMTTGFSRVESDRGKVQGLFAQGCGSGEPPLAPEGPRKRS
jgi:lipopolysaccharide export system protein LptA